ncbi:MAG: hypothetical protein J0M29_14135 [Chitinophagales bacterium]|nr:hypothetical protein [Chitinophagales bacterium]
MLNRSLYCQYLAVSASGEQLIWLAAGKAGASRTRQSSLAMVQVNVGMK